MGTCAVYHFPIFRFYRILYIKFTTGVPHVFIDKNNYQVDYGDNVTINCTVDAEPQVTDIFWIKSDSQQIITLNTGLPGTEGMTVDVPSLTITYATETDAGLYACYAINKRGTGNSKTARVTVKGGKAVLKLI